MSTNKTMKKPNGQELFILKELNLVPISEVIKKWEEKHSETEEWILFLTVTPKKTKGESRRFPMTPIDVSRARKRTQVETIVESVEEDDGILVPAMPLQPVRRASRAASKIASMKMKEGHLNTKLRRPSNFDSKEPCDMNKTRVFATAAPPPPKRPRRGRSNMPRDDSSTAESSFASARESITSLPTKTDDNTKPKNEEMDIDNDVLSENIGDHTKTTLKLTKKLSLQVETVTIMQTSKKVTKQQITAVIESPAKSMIETKIATRLETSYMFASDDNFCMDSPKDNTPLVHLLSKRSKIKNTDLIVKQEPISPKCNTADDQNTTNDQSYKTMVVEKTFGLTAINELVPVIELQSLDSKLIPSAPNMNKISDLRMDTSNIEEQIKTGIAPTSSANMKSNSFSCNQMQPPVIAKKPFAEAAAITKESMMDKKMLKNSKPKALNNATNRNNATPEATRNGINRNLEPLSVKKRVEELEKNLIVEPAVPAKLDMPVRITRTKAKAMLATNLDAVLPLSEKKVLQKVETSYLLKMARKSLLKAKKICVAKDRKELDLQKSIEKENTPPLQNAARPREPQSMHSTRNKNKSTPNPFTHPSRLLAQISITKQPMSNNTASTSNIITNISSFLPKTKVVTAAEEAEEKRKDEIRHRFENKKDALLKKKAIMDDKIEQQKRKREEKEKNVLLQRALLEREKVEMQTRAERENEEKVRLLQEREEGLKKKMMQKKEEAKQKAARIEERRVRKEAERIQALKLQEEEQLRLQAQKKKEQEEEQLRLQAQKKKEQEEAERQHIKRVQEEKEKEKKEKEEATLREAQERQEKLKQAKKVTPMPVLDSTFVVDTPAATQPRAPLVEASKHNYPLLDLTRGNDSDFSEGEEDIFPEWACQKQILKTSQYFAHVPSHAIRIFFDCKPTTPDLTEIFPNKRYRHGRSSSAVWRSPPRCSMLPNGF